MKRKYWLGILLILSTLGLLYSFGPKPSFPELDPTISTLDIPIVDLESYIAEREASVDGLRPNNHARIVWVDSVRQTPYSLVYLHGFSASPMEGDPMHVDFADRYGCNLFLARLHGHGIMDQDAFADLTPQHLIDSAKEAIAIGKIIGEKVIVMSTSTGGTLSIFLGAYNPAMIYAQILYSPNIDLYNQTSKILTYPWGLQIGQMIEGKRRHLELISPEIDNYWTTTYRMEGLVVLRYLLDKTMTDRVFSRIKQPFFVGYYYKNDTLQDQTISIPAVRSFYEKVNTPPALKSIQAFPEVAHHVMISNLRSKDLQSVKAATYRFAEEVLSLQPVR